MLSELDEADSGRRFELNPRWVAFGSDRREFGIVNGFHFFLSHF